MFRKIAKYRSVVAVVERQISTAAGRAHTEFPGKGAKNIDGEELGRRTPVLRRPNKQIPKWRNVGLQREKEKIRMNSSIFEPKDSF